MLYRPTHFVDRLWMIVSKARSALSARRGRPALAMRKHAFLEDGNAFLMRDIGYVQHGERPDPWKLVRDRR
jgi:hypothetical protein